MEQIGEPLGLSLLDAAWGIHAVANASMERAMRSMSMDRGRDPRNYAMVAFGGAGPLHVARLARALGVPQVIVPWGAGVGSAVGLLDADPKFSVSQTSLLAIAPDSSDAIAAIYARLEERVKNEVPQIDRASQVEWQRFAYLRYQGQGYELKIDLPAGTIGGGYAARINEIFNTAYQNTYGYSQPDNMIEAADWYLTATLPTGLSSGETELAVTDRGSDNAGGAGAKAGRQETRKAYFQDCGDYDECKVVDRYALKPGDMVEGPAIVEEREATTVILPGNVAEVRPSGHLIITMGEA